MKVVSFFQGLILILLIGFSFAVGLAVGSHSKNAKECVSVSKGYSSEFHGDLVPGRSIFIPVRDH